MKMKNKNQERLNETKSQFFKIINKICKKKKSHKTERKNKIQITSIRNKTRAIIADLPNLKKDNKGMLEQLYTYFLQLR